MNERHGAVPTAHGPNYASATHAGRSPPLGDLLSQRRGPLPKLLWADLFLGQSGSRCVFELTARPLTLVIAFETVIAYILLLGCTNTLLIAIHKYVGCRIHFEALYSPDQIQPVA